MTTMSEIRLLKRLRFYTAWVDIGRSPVSDSRAALYRSDFRAGTIPSKFNIVEREMGKQQAQTSKEMIWRDHLARHAASGKSIAAFCRTESIS